MNIIATQYTLEFKSFDIYVSGCTVHCPGCHNPESWDFSVGNLYDDDLARQINEKVISFKKMIKNIMIFGGEPLDQPEKEFLPMLKKLNELDIPIWLFTSYDLKDVPSSYFRYLSYIKTGRYIKELTTDDNTMFGIKLATSNQVIHTIERFK